jgi:hypothetical protein
MPPPSFAFGCMLPTACMIKGAFISFLGWGGVAKQGPLCLERVSVASESWLGAGVLVLDA